MGGAQFNRGNSKQDHQTPLEFLDAVRTLLGISQFSLDIAASPENTVCPHFYTIEDNALEKSWLSTGWSWCNPPFANIDPWASKAIKEFSAHHSSSCLLLPASVGSNWWEKYVHNRVSVLFLNGRITFKGSKDPYPKDCALLVYAMGWQPGYRIWRWRDCVSNRKIV